MSKQWEAGLCNEKSGFLFSHKCFRFHDHTCEQCEKPICEEHTHQAGGAMFCTSCLKKMPQAQPVGRHHNPSDDHSSSHGYHYNSPYFYGGYYYGHSYYASHGHGSSSMGTPDPADFTEADAESLESEFDADFESDMSES